MNTPAESRPFPRWLHVWAITTVVVTTLLLILGGLVTTFKVGMADPVWPTEPWALAMINWQEKEPGFLIEHTHRLFGFLTGGFVSVLSIGLWFTDRNKLARFAGLVPLVAFLALFGQFHGKMTAQKELLVAVWPMEVIYALLGSLAVILLISIGRCFAGAQGSGVRLLGVIALVAVMIQGMLGGLRVRFNELAGTDLAAVHGSFAQIVFSLLIAIAVLTRRPGPVMIPEETRRRLRWQTISLVLFAYMQIIWGAWIRHSPDAIGIRLHLIFAFVVVGFATLVMKQGLSDPESKAKLKFPFRVLMGLITVQILLGVEAWIGKFLGPTLPELEKITVGKAVIRTIHAHTGTWILAVSVIVALLVRKNPATPVGPTAQGNVDWKESPRPEPSLAGTAGITS
ncbi:COX15/CtaA family protein [Zavarzinella formosa]|uniref:hypothetical protein n=1 Tax=Zavarzinella formosa TaxID=360055 RepID=UPI0002EDACFA|nr:hypothetical protein [Zavarzinella formosa]